MNKSRRKSANKSQRSSGQSVISNSGPGTEIGMTSFSALSPSDIPANKWREIIDEAEQDFIVNSIREEIIRNAFDAIYAKYLENTSYAFVVHCSYLAWIKLFNLIHLKHDPGESPQTIADNWSCDEPPIPVPADPWACHRMTIPKEKKSVPREDEFCTQDDSECLTMTEVKSSISVPSFTFPFPEAEKSNQLPNEEDSLLIPKHQDSKSEIIIESLSNVSDKTSYTSLSQRQRSIFTRTISMAKADLPVTKWQWQRQGFKYENLKRDRGSCIHAVAAQPPEPLDLETLPPDRIDIECVIVPESGKFRCQPKNKNKRTAKKLTRS